MQTVEEIKKLRNNANEIRSLFKSKIPKWESDPKYYDKTDYGFNKDPRFNACEAISIAFSSYMGSYGNSGSSTQCSLDKNIFGAHLLKYLNGNKEHIMLAIADSIEREAASLKEKAEKELNAQIESLKELEASVKPELIKIENQ